MNPRAPIIFGLPMPCAGALAGMHLHAAPAALLATWCLLWAGACGVGLLAALIRLGESE